MKKLKISESKVSIIMPFFNEGSRLDRAIEGVVNQSYSFWELILIDDGSTDNSLTIAKEWAENDLRVKVYVSEINRGQVFAINWGLELASSNIVAFCDADDVWLSHKLLKQLECMEQGSVNVVCGRSQYCNWETGYKSNPTPIYGKIKYNELLGGNRVGFSTLLINRLGLEVPTFHALNDGLIHHDFVFLLQLFQRNKNLLVIELPEVVCMIGLREGLSSNKWRAIQSQWWILRQVAELPMVHSIWKMVLYTKFVLQKRGLRTIWHMLNI
jgi:teichuronic acid biosynthesis glycosyltransferase TuaG